MGDGEPLVRLRIAAHRVHPARVKDVDFDQHQLIVRDGKGGKDRITMLPDRLVEPLRTHLDKVACCHKKDLSEGFGAVYLPFALEKKYPSANREWAWQ